MPKPVIFTYAKKRSQIDNQNSLFDRLIQDVSNNTVKKVRENNYTDPNLSIFSLDDESPVKKNVANKVKKTNSIVKEATKRKNDQNEETSSKKKESLKAKNRKQETNKEEHEEVEEKTFPTQESSIGMNLRSKKVINQNSEKTKSNIPTSQSFGLSSQLSDISLSKQNNSTIIQESPKPIQSAKLTKSVSLSDTQKITSNADFGLSSTEDEDDVNINDSFKKTKLKQIKLVKSSSDTATFQQSPAKLSQQQINESPRSKQLGTKFSLFSGGYSKRIPIKFNSDIYCGNLSPNHEMLSNKSPNRDETSIDFPLTQTRKAYECEELGEIQGLIDDTIYLMDGLDKTVDISQRCLSAIKLAEYCINSDFRMHLRTHGTISKIFELLNDSPKDANLALSTSCIIFTLSRDKLVMDMDESSFELMMTLLKTSLPNSDFINENKFYKKNFERCKNVCEKIDDLSLIVNLNSHVLLIECLLSLSTKRLNGNWFKDSLRKYGTIDLIIDMLENNINIEGLLKYSRFFKLLENATNLNGINQNYLCCMDNDRFFNLIKATFNCLFNDLKQDNIESSKKKLFSDIIKDIYLILVNLTYKNEFCAKIMGENNEFIDMIFLTQMEIIPLISNDEQFDVLIMALGVHLNILNLNPHFRIEFERNIKSRNTLDFIIELYNEKQTLVSKAEIDTVKEWNKLNNETSETSNNGDNLNVTIMNSIHQAGKHMEDHIIAAHSAMILGYILLGDHSNKNEIKEKLNQKSFENVIEIIKKFLVFLKIMKINGLQEDENLQQMLSLFQEFEKSDKPITEKN